MPFWSRGLYPVDRSGVPEMAMFQQVLKVASEQAPPGTAILVIGSASGAHQQLWAPVRLDRLFFYDDWMWYWQLRHRGPYDPVRSSRYDPERLDDLFEPEYLERHGIGSVVVAQSEQPVADIAPTLRRIFGGTYGVYAVADPVRIVTLAGRTPDALDIANGSIVATGTSAGGDAVIRRNWFPRWRAEVNGHTTPIVESDDGYMRVPIPAGRVELNLRYELDRFDVAGRAAALAGGALLVFFFRKRRPLGD
jgi:hypothetical protein